MFFFHCNQTLLFLFSTFLDNIFYIKQIEHPKSIFEPKSNKMPKRLQNHRFYSQINYFRNIENENLFQIIEQSSYKFHI